MRRSLGAVAVSERLLADEYFASPRRRRGTELVAGTVVVNELAVRHQRLALRLLVSLRRWSEEGEGRGEAFLPLDVRLDDANVFAPDVLWLSDARRPAWDISHLVEVPELAVEVRSPGTWRFDIGAKLGAYERHGLPELWLVDSAARTVIVYRRSGRSVPTFDVALELGVAEALTSPQLEGFSLAVDELFAE
jgi:Uma2 family endonuclease